LGREQNRAYCLALDEYPHAAFLFTWRIDCTSQAGGRRFKSCRGEFFILNLRIGRLRIVAAFANAFMLQGVSGRTIFPTGRRH
jgi:hypothetical protein